METEYCNRHNEKKEDEVKIVLFCLQRIKTGKDIINENMYLNGILRIPLIVNCSSPLHGILS